MILQFKELIISYNQGSELNALKITQIYAYSHRYVLKNIILYGYNMQ